MALFVRRSLRRYLSSSNSPLRSSSSNQNQTPDTVLFEGCDSDHWLITMKFTKDPKYTPEKMVETYVQTLAQVVGRGKRKMYACSTTTYTGFQAVMSEEMADKLNGVPGVVFIIPDSYIDPVNKEYGGDKYDNGVITPRPATCRYHLQPPEYPLVGNYVPLQDDQGGC